MKASDDTTNHGCSVAFLLAMASLREHGVAPVHVGFVLERWREMVAQAAPDEPTVEITAAGAVKFSWNSKRYYADLDIHPDNSIEWYWRDRDANASDGTTGEPLRYLDPAFYRYLRRCRA